MSLYSSFGDCSIILKRDRYDFDASNKRLIVDIKQLVIGIADLVWQVYDGVSGGGNWIAPRVSG